MDKVEAQEEAKNDKVLEGSGMVTKGSWKVLVGSGKVPTG